MSFHVRVPDHIHKDFSKACKVLRFKQNAIIEVFMLKIINTAQQVETLKNSIDCILDTPLNIHNLENNNVAKNGQK